MFFLYPGALHWKVALSVMGIRLGAKRFNGIQSETYAAYWL